jgi:hypothetical protein
MSATLDYAWHLPALDRVDRASMLAKSALCCWRLRRKIYSFLVAVPFSQSNESVIRLRAR